jgi:hypothetical protein
MFNKINMLLRIVIQVKLDRTIIQLKSKNYGFGFVPKFPACP